MSSIISNNKRTRYETDTDSQSTNSQDYKLQKIASAIKTIIEVIIINHKYKYLFFIMLFIYIFYIL
jgi:hypothetical protein